MGGLWPAVQKINFRGTGVGRPEVSLGVSGGRAAPQREGLVCGSPPAERGRLGGGIPPGDGENQFICCFVLKGHVRYQICLTTWLLFAPPAQPQSFEVGAQTAESVPYEHLRNVRFRKSWLQH